MQLEPPEKLKNRQPVLKKLAVYKCDTSKNGVYGALWELAGAGFLLVFETAHTKIGDLTEALEIIKMCRSNSIVTVMEDANGSFYKKFLARVCTSSMRKIKEIT